MSLTLAMLGLHHFLAGRLTDATSRPTWAWAGQAYSFGVRRGLDIPQPNPARRMYDPSCYDYKEE